MFGLGSAFQFPSFDDALSAVNRFVGSFAAKPAAPTHGLHDLSDHAHYALLTAMEAGLLTQRSIRG
jgi:hypothetical protein